MHKNVMIQKLGSKTILLLSFFVAIFLITSCKEKPVNKPKGYFKIDFPKHQYQSFNQEGYPYSFEFPAYANIIKDSSFFGEATENPRWINVDFPKFNSRIYISYKEIGKNKLDSLLRHSFKLADAHNSKATFKDDSLIITPNNVNGMLFQLGGNVATANQFFVTDSSKHFLRGALYFDATPNEDSLKIVNDFLLEDMRHLINTLKWKN
jgi:gliding motility-associated lipoprotein GldD